MSTEKNLLEHVDKTGHGYAAEHICWQRGRFIAFTAVAADKEGGHINVLTPKEYQAKRRRKS